MYFLYESILIKRAGLPYSMQSEVRSMHSQHTFTALRASAHTHTHTQTPATGGGFMGFLCLDPAVGPLSPHTLQIIMAPLKPLGPRANLCCSTRRRGRAGGKPLGGDGRPPARGGKSDLGRNEGRITRGRVVGVGTGV